MPGGSSASFRACSCSLATRAAILSSDSLTASSTRASCFCLRTVSAAFRDRALRFAAARSGLSVAGVVTVVGAAGFGCYRSGRLVGHAAARDGFRVLGDPVCCLGSGRSPGAVGRARRGTRLRVRAIRVAPWHGCGTDDVNMWVMTGLARPGLGSISSAKKSR